MSSMGLFDLIRRLNPFALPVPEKVGRLIALELARGKGLSLKPHVSTLAFAAVKAAVEDLEQAPAAELIMRLVEESQRLWLETAKAVSVSPSVDRSVARRAGSKVKEFSRAFGSDLMLQHLTNLVLSETGLGTEAGVLKPDALDLPRFARRLSELVRLSVSSVSDAELAVIPLPQPSPQRLADA